METMINGTLDLSRLEAGTWVVQPREVALPQLIDTVVADLQADAAQKRIALEVRSLPYLVMTDPTAFGRIPPQLGWKCAPIYSRSSPR